MASPSLGMACMLQIDTTVVAAKLTACSASVMLNYRKIIFAQGGSNALAGYAPGAGAKSGFSVTFKAAYGTAPAVINNLLSTAGVPVSMQFGDAGGLTITPCVAFDVKVTGSEGQDIEIAVTFESVNMPTDGTVLTAPATTDNIFGFQDAASITLVSGATYTIFNSFSFAITRTRAAYVGNSKTGLPQELGVAYTEVKVDCEWLKQNDAEADAFLGSGPPLFAPTPGDVTIVLTQITGGAASFTMVAQQCYYDTRPHNTGSETDWVKESATAVATHGAFTIS